MLSHDLYNTQILSVVRDCGYSDCFIEYVKCDNMQIISPETNNLITSTVGIAYVSDKTKRIVLLTRNIIDKRSLVKFIPKIIAFQARSNHYPIFHSVQF